MAHLNEYDLALIFSQDQDLSQVASEIRNIAREQNRWIKVACAFPLSPTTRNRRGIEKTDWVPIDRAAYDSCIDRRDYRINDFQNVKDRPRDDFKKTLKENLKSSILSILGRTDKGMSKLRRIR
jgi:hypothetical protein